MEEATQPPIIDSPQTVFKLDDMKRVSSTEGCMEGSIVTVSAEDNFEDVAHRIDEIVSDGPITQYDVKSIISSTHLAVGLQICSIPSVSFTAFVCMLCGEILSVFSFGQPSCFVHAFLSSLPPER